MLNKEAVFEHFQTIGLKRYTPQELYQYQADLANAIAVGVNRLKGSPVEPNV